MVDSEHDGFVEDLLPFQSSKKNIFVVAHNVALYHISYELVFVFKNVERKKTRHFQKY